MLQKQPIAVSFAQGLDTKTDPKQVQIGKMLSLENSVFNKGGLLQKRNGYGQLKSLPSSTVPYSYLTTFNQNLTAIGNEITAYNAGVDRWYNKGAIQPLSLNTLPVVRNNFFQVAGDIAVAPNGIACAAYLEYDGTNTVSKFVVFDSITGQNIIEPSLIPVSSGTVIDIGMRVFVLGNNFILTFGNNIAGTDHLQYITISVINQAIGPNTDIASSYVHNRLGSYDGYVVNNNLYIAYDTLAGGQSIKIVYLTAGLTLSSPVTYAGQIATMVSVTADNTNPANPIIYVSYYDTVSQNGFSLAVNKLLNPIMAPVHIITGVPVLNITSAAMNGHNYIYYEVDNNYGFDAADPTHYIVGVDLTEATSTFTSAILIRSVGLASKAFIMNGIIYTLVVYQSPYQPTYFLVPMSETTTAIPIIAAKLAYANGGGYLTFALPGVSIIGNDVKIAYLFKDLITAVNKNTNVPSGSQTAGIYSQLGLNLASFTIGTQSLDTTEIGSNLNISGGFLWMYDGFVAVEQNFFLWPDMDTVNPTDAAAWSAAGGSMAAQPDGATNTNAYFYQVTYEWTDNQGNAFRSAPSIPIPVTTTGMGNTGSVTLNIPTLRLTMKTATPVKIVIYRWSVAQQVYYQTTSVQSPLQNDTTVDYVTFVDTNSDAFILGNNILYTTGGVVENIGPPATDLLTIFDTRLWLVDSEDRNLLWYSKQVIEATPVEMSDLFTVFIPPTTSTQGSTGPITSIAPLDDKLIIGKENAFYYINGTGPDNTGAQNQYSQPIFITATVGCTNQKSLVLMPQGLMFQSDKGIWLLDRGLQTSYIGSPVEKFTLGATVTSAVNVPETNEVRFTLDSGITLMYDYFYGQWGTFVNVPAVSSCIFKDLHTFINSFGAAYQESPGLYLDGSNPVLMQFQTGPLRLGDLQNYQRAYFFYLLGTYLSPHKLQLSMTYDYGESPSQSVIITPTNFSTNYGSGPPQSPYGQGSPYGGPGSLEDWRVFLDRQRCQAFSITMQEVFDPTFGTVAGAGLTLSGLNVICAFKRGYRPQPAAHSAGS